MDHSRRPRRRGNAWLAGITLLVWMLVGGWLLASSIAGNNSAEPVVAAVQTPEPEEPAGEAAGELNPSRPEGGLAPGDCLVDVRGMRIDLTRSRAELERLGVRTDAVWPASRREDNVALAVATSYRVNCREFGDIGEDPGAIYLDGYVGHRGGLRFATERGQVEIRRPRINVNNGTLEGTVTGTDMAQPFFQLWWSDGVRADSDTIFRLHRVPVVLTAEAASLLNQTLSTAAFAPGIVMGEASVAGEIKLAGPPEVTEPG